MKKILTAEILQRAFCESAMGAESLIRIIIRIIRLKLPEPTLSMTLSFLDGKEINHHDVEARILDYQRHVAKVMRLVALVKNGYDLHTPHRIHQTSNAEKKIKITI